MSKNACREAARFLCTLCIAFAPHLAAAQAQPDPLPRENFTALWWNPAESGWGLNLTHQGDVLFGTLFTYDANRNPLWLVMSEGRLLADGSTYAGALYRTTGPAFNAHPFTPLGPGNLSRVGDMRIAFGAGGATLDYDVDGVRVKKDIARQVFGAAPATCTATTLSRAGATNYQDLWWNPDESGWGLNLTHQGNVIFATLFTYGLDGRGVWLVMSSGNRQADGSYTGDLYRTVGSPFNAAPIAPLTPADITRVGTMTLRFADGTTGMVDYSVDGVAVTKVVTRQVFSDPQAACTSPTPSEFAYTNATVYRMRPEDSLAQAPEITAVTRHRVTVDGAVLDYTATAGHLNTTGARKASFFYVAYTLEGAAPASRPVTFVYNGGPGNSTMWLHLGSFGPKRLVTGLPATTMAVPYALVDNAQSLLDITDLVFVDAVGTGYSQAIAPATNQAFMNVESDAEVFNDFILRYLAVNNRPASAIFLMGESYGGIRAAVMARKLEASGTPVSGLVLVSPVLDYNANCEASTAACTGHIPSYATIAAYHGLASPRSHDEMRAFASNEYAPAVEAFLSSGTPPSSSLLDRLMATTGLPRDAWQANPNRSPSYYRQNLIPGMFVGRYDARVTIPTGNLPPVDPSLFLIQDSFQARLGEYLASTLRYTTPSAYAISSPTRTFSLGYRGRIRPDAVPDLAEALDRNPLLKVMAIAGYHDLAAPFFNTERDLARLGSRANVRIHHYDGGHMSYLDDVSRPQMKADLRRFYADAVPAGNLAKTGGDQEPMLSSSTVTPSVSPTSSRPSR